MIRRTRMLEQVNTLDFFLDPDGDGGLREWQADESTDPGFFLGAAFAAEKLPASLVPEATLQSILSSHGHDLDAGASLHRVLLVATESEEFYCRSQWAQTAQTRRDSCRVACWDEESEADPTFFDVYLFSRCWTSDTPLLAIGRQYFPLDHPHANNAHWIAGSWSDEISAIDASNIVDLVGAFETGISSYVFPCKGSLGGYTSWWARFCRKRRAREDRRHRGEYMPFLLAPGLLVLQFPPTDHTPCRLALHTFTGAA